MASSVYEIHENKILNDATISESDKYLKLGDNFEYMNYIKASYYYQKGCELNNYTCLVKLGFAYKNGTLGLQVNHKISDKLLQKVIESDDTDALILYGDMESDRISHSKVRLYKKAFELNNVNAFSKLYRLYSKYNISSGLKILLDDAKEKLLNLLIKMMN